MGPRWAPRRSTDSNRTSSDEPAPNGEHVAELMPRGTKRLLRTTWLGALTNHTNESMASCTFDGYGSTNAGMRDCRNGFP